MKTFKYQQVIDYIRKEYIDTPGGASEIPSEPELASRLKISRFPVNRAVTHLVDEGVLCRINGVGTFIKGKAPEVVKRRVRGNPPMLALVSKVGIIRENELPQAIQNAVSDREMIFSSFCNPEDVASCEAFMERTKKYNLKGVFIIPNIHFGGAESSSLEFAEKLTSRNIPVVVVERVLPGYHGMQVVTDNANGILCAVQELSRRGMKKIAYLGKDDYLVGAERLMGYKLGLEYCGLPVDDSLMVIDRHGANFIPYLDELIDNGVGRIAEKHPDCHGFIAFNITFAFRLYQKLQKNGMITKDTLIAGFDPPLYYDEEFLKHYITIQRPFAEIGKMAMEMMLSRIEAGNQSQEIRRIMPSLVMSENQNPAAYHAEMMFN